MLACEFPAASILGLSKTVKKKEKNENREAEE